MVECGGLENRLARNPGHGGSNPPSSATLHAAGTGNRACFVFSPSVKRCEHLTGLSEFGHEKAPAETDAFLSNYATAT